MPSRRLIGPGVVDAGSRQYNSYGKQAMYTGLRETNGVLYAIAFFHTIPQPMNHGDLRRAMCDAVQEKI